jgi:hypothetical protein
MAEAARAEACAVHSVQIESGYGIMFLGWEGPRGWEQKAVHSKNLEAEVVRLVSENLDCDLYVSQQSFSRARRRAKDLLALGVIAMDLDVEKALGQFDIAAIRDAVSDALKSAGVPLPSHIVFSGHGLHLKWLLKNTIPAKAVRRWAAINRELLRILAPWGADAQAVDPCRVLRLAGTFNHKPTAAGRSPEARVVWPEGAVDASGWTRYDFEELATAILPLTREQCATAKKAAKAKRRRIARWKRNQQRARALLRVTKNPGKAATTALPRIRKHWLMSECTPIDIAIFNLAAGRLVQLESAVEQIFPAGVVPKGKRNGVGWLAATCIVTMAVSCGGGDTFSRLCQWAARMMPSMSVEELQGMASSVLTRAKHATALTEGATGLYHFKNAKWVGLLATALEVPADALPENGRSAGARQSGPGKLGFSKLKNLPTLEFVRQVKARQAAGARYAATVRCTNHDPRVVQLAKRLALEGITTQKIAEELDVPRRTVAGWVTEIRAQHREERTGSTPATGIQKGTEESGISSQMPSLPQSRQHGLIYGEARVGATALEVVATGQARSEGAFRGKGRPDERVAGALVLPARKQGVPQQAGRANGRATDGSDLQVGGGAEVLEDCLSPLEAPGLSARLMRTLTSGSRQTRGLALPVDAVQHVGRTSTRTVLAASAVLTFENG